MPSILLVEDDPLMLTVLTMCLRRAGHFVLQASTFEQARKLLVQEPIDLLVSDLTLPDADGDGLAALCKVPAIAMSGLPDIEARQRSLRAGFARHLAKPFELELLTTAITQLTLGKSTASR
ncbi:MAG: response regulator [Planctomycetota bacterium]|nr:response regulator [Planctomycetota bacterium]